MRSLWISVVFFACSACGSAPDASVFSGGGDDAGFDGSTGGGDTSTTTDSSATSDTHHGGKDVAPGDDTTPPPEDTTPPPPDVPTGVTLDTVCSRLADVICSTPTQTCCTTHAVPYDAGGCRSGVAAWCDADVAAVGAGTMTFDASAWDACSSALSTIESTCSVPILDYVKAYVPCNQLFNGTGDPGSPCSSVADCHADPGSYAECRSESGTCEQVVVVPKDGACTFSGPVLQFCDAGLYCSTSTNTCHTAKSPGSGCAGGFDSSCGFGSSCTGGHCGPGLPEGSPCTGGLQCASWTCTTSGCSDPNVEWATPQTCSGG